MPSRFVHLHTHSHYSLLQALPKIKALVKATVERGMPALALTDAGNMYGAIEFYKECQKQGIKPILGVDFYVAARKRTDKEPRIDNRRSRLVMLAKDMDGYQNLIKLVTDSQIEGFYYKPRIDKELIEKYSKGLVVISPSFSGEITQAVKADNLDHAREIANFYKKIFGDDFYMEITHHPELDGHEDTQKKLIAFAHAENIPLVAAHDTYYLNREDKAARETLVLIQDQFSERNTDDEADFSFITVDEAEEYFKDLPEALNNCQKIVEKCNLNLELGKWLFPNFIVESGKTADDELRDLAYAGISRRRLERTPDVIERLDYELSVIKTKGYSPYFLTVADLLAYAHKNGILTNIRGSVAGSMTTYLTGITNVNPLEYKLPFERFLNPERPSAPDIDMDFADNRRDEMIDYSRRKYGHDKVAQIGTFGTMMARGAVRDVARAMKFPYTLGDRISKLIPMGQQGFAMTIDRAIEMTPELKEMYEKEADVKAIIDMAKKIEGCARHISVHAAGVVISPIPLTDIVPLQLDPKGEGRVITQYDMRSVDENNAGLLKFDFLGIKNLSQLADAVALAEKIEGVKVDLENIPLDDQLTFDMLARGETEGLFQLNGAGMTRYLKELKPTTIHDINAMVALYRPGPMETIPEYIKRKNDPSLVKYEDPRMEKFLKESHGLIVYQDDLLFCAIDLAGYSWLEADKFRKAVGKKIREEMAAQKEKFTEGIVKNGQTRKFANHLWKLFEPFQAYGFNKCLSGDTIITDVTTGARASIRDIYEKNIQVTVGSLNNHKKIQPAEMTAVMENGGKNVFELTTRSGKKIKATANHPFYTIDGWKNLEGLEIKERIALPRILNVNPKDSESEFKSAILGYLLSEGNLCHPHGIYFYSTKEDELQDFIQYANKFKNIKITIDRSKSAASVYVGQIDQRKGNELSKWIIELGLRNKKATVKFVPDYIFGRSLENIAIFLGKLWQGDGCINLKDLHVYYATSSEKLASDVQHLLLRLGIFSSIHQKSFKYRGGIKIGYTINISHRNNLIKFSETAGKHLIGEKRVLLQKLYMASQTVILNNGMSPARGTKDIIPASILTRIKSYASELNLSTKVLAADSGISERLLSYDAAKIGYQRDVISRIGKSLNSNEISEYGESDVYWDEIVSIIPRGKEMTYDLTVPPCHNFIANDIIVHNSHAASYGRLAYQTAYMKANFPAIYMAAVLTGAHGDIDEIGIYITECKRMGIPVLAPDINESFGNFTVIKGGGMDAAASPIPDKIRFGLYSIKNFGEGIANTIIEERKKNGRFKNLEDFLNRIKDKNLNKKSLEALIKSGAMDEFGDRGIMYANVPDILEYNKEQHKQSENQDSLFGLAGPGTESHLKLHAEGKATPSEKLAWEKELLGLYISGHPLDKYKKILEGRDINIEMIKTTGKEEKVFIFGGIIEEAKEIITKKDSKRMMFLKVADLTGSIEVVAFPKSYDQYKALLIAEKCVVIKGKFSSRNGSPSILIDIVKALE